MLLAGRSLTAQKVVAALDPVVAENTPQRSTVDNGCEFASRRMDAWAYRHGIQLELIRPGRPVENSLIESLNGRLRDEYLNVEIFFSIEDAQEKLEKWRVDYNQRRPHSSLQDQTPHAFALACEGKQTGGNNVSPVNLPEPYWEGISTSPT